MQRRRARPYHCDAFHFSFRRAAAYERSRVGSGTPCITAGFAKRSVQRAARLEIRRTASPPTRALGDISEHRAPTTVTDARRRTPSPAAPSSPSGPPAVATPPFLHLISRISLSPACELAFIFNTSTQPCEFT